MPDPVRHDGRPIESKGEHIRPVTSSDHVLKMLDRPIATIPPPIARKTRAAREGLWVLTCFLAVAALYITVISNAHGGPHGGLLNIPPKAWADVWDAVLAGHFWIATGTLYGLFQTIRLTVWAVRTSLRRADSKRTVPRN